MGSAVLVVHRESHFRGVAAEVKSEYLFMKVMIGVLTKLCTF